MYPDPILYHVHAMSLDEKIGQLITVGMEGYEVNDAIRDLVTQKHVGGIILFRKNIRDAQQVVTLTNGLKNLPKTIPLFLSVDEEGGRVSRMPAEVMALPSSGKIGAKKDARLSYRIGQLLGEEVAGLGFNMDFAPVLDIHTNEHNPVIGIRAFSREKEVVATLGIATLKGIQEKRNVIAVVKHFPGHGDTDVDSHKGLPVLHHDRQRLQEMELYPFQRAIEDGADAVMVGHLLFPKIDAQYPSSMSKTIIMGMLREELGFKGIVITDDLTMRAIPYKIDKAVVQAISSGVDIALVCHGYERALAAIEGLKQAVTLGVISQQQIDESVYRILTMKQKYHVSNDVLPSFNVEKMNEKIKETLKELP